MRRALSLGAILAVAGALGAQTITLQEGVESYAGTADTSIFSENTNTAGGGGGLFAGVTRQGNARRALMRFDLASIPADAQVVSASLSLRIDMIAPGGAGESFRLFALARPWGEGTAVPAGAGGLGAAPAEGDATWLSSFHGITAWTNAGGDFVPVASATGIGAATETDLILTGTRLAADVAAFIADPAGNHGWILLGNESAEGTAYRFVSSEGTAGVRPRLTVVLAEPAPHPDSWLLH